LRRLALAAFLAAAAGAASAATVVKDPRHRSVTAAMVPLPVHAVGRMVVEPLGPPMPAGAAAYVHQWPGVYFEAAFRGDRVVLAFADPANEYRLLVDDQAPIAIAQPGDGQIRVEDLGPGPHRLRLEKVTESVGARGAFRGFFVARAADVEPAPSRPRQIEFIGDSTMAGFGARSGKIDCPGDEARLTSDTQDAYAALAARKLDADYQVNAISGRGLVRNFGGADPEGALLKVYPFTFLDRTVPYVDPGWRPQIVVVRLIADFVSPVKPGERWANLNQVANDYVQGYASLIAEVRARAPAATILIQWPSDRELGEARNVAAFANLRRAIAGAAAGTGAPLAFFDLDVGADIGAACAYHPSLAQQAKMAAALAAYISAHPEYWQGR
jgi:hypothetical protein